MTRIGINPARGRTLAERPQSITVCMVTYIPERSGYFANRLEVLKVSLASLTAHTASAHDVMIFDNGSCAEVVDYLRDLQSNGTIHYLLLSGANIGKIDALRILFQACPGETIAYSDDDIFYYPGWLEAHLELLESFPLAGMVSGAAVRNAARHARRSLEALAEAPPAGLTIERRRCIPDEWEADWAISTGRDPQAHLEATREIQDLVLRAPRPAGGFIEAIGSANHFQFVAPKAVILQALPETWTGKLMGSMIELDEAVDNQGRLRLSTLLRYTRHMGNALSPEMLGEARALGLDPESTSLPAHSARKRRPILRIPGARRLLSAAYRRLFEILYQ